MIRTDPISAAGMASGLPVVEDWMWPGYCYADGPPPFATVRNHKPPGWPHGHPCWCGEKQHDRALPPGPIHARSQRLLSRLRRWLP